MGMFDSIYLDVKCPRCGADGLKEFQTKDMECELNTYHAGDKVADDKYRYLDCRAMCVSPECLKWEQDTYKGMSNGFGFGWDARVKVAEGGIIVGSIPEPLSHPGQMKKEM